jgi:uncharacterized membrane protein
LLIITTTTAVVIIDWMALFIVLIGTAQAFVGALRLAFSGRDAVHRQEVWLRFGRWLVAGLTF